MRARVPLRVSCDEGEGVMFNVDYCLNGCTIIDAHKPGCVGLAWAGGRPVECPGCLPQPVERGMLCWSCCAKVDELWEVLPDLVPHLRSVERGPAAVGERTHAAFGPRMIIPESWQAADRLWRLMHELIVFEANAERVDAPSWAGGTGPDWFGTFDGIETVMRNVWDAEFWLLCRLQRLYETPRVARALLRLVDAVVATLRRFPLEERAHRVEHVRCRKCGMLTLEWRPPLDFDRPVTVTCVNRLCAAVYDPQMVEWDARLLREQYEAAQAAVA